MPQLFRNNAFSALGASLTNVATTLTVTTGHGDRFPAVTAPDFFMLTLQDASNNIEIVRVTARTAGADSMTIQRAQEGTTARAWNIGDVVELRLTAFALNPLGLLEGSATAAAVRAILDVPTRAGGNASGTWNISISGNAATATTATTATTTTGNAGTATTLQTARNINGVSFNGSADITLPTVNTTGDQTIGGVKTFSSPIAGSITGNAATATTAATANAVSNGAVGTAGVADDAVTFAKLQNIPTATILGRSTAGTGDVEALTGAQVAAIVGSRAPIQHITASVAANALTLTLHPTVLDFRSATPGSGAVNTRTVSAALNLTVPSGATLGTISAVASRIALLAIDNAGTVELAAVNMAGGVNLDEATPLISITAISGTANSATVVYSQTARTNVPFRVVGYVESTQTTAGAWATAPSLVHGAGGLALAAMQSFGYGQNWQNVTGVRVVGTTYYNTTGKPITVVISSNTTGATTTFLINGTSLINDTMIGPFSYQVPPGQSYLLAAAGGGLRFWHELR